ncbi:hypothetical protein [Polaribacter glomeratus]|nr:hypothetical protein [Polaribacter glomeratus]TXD64171.1 hypothetical protein ESX12_15785 [Polaribacter glomeratus]TXD64177.1 hypothetical protein ESX12_15815 [Polaribacter glomeratus]
MNKNIIIIAILLSFQMMSCQNMTVKLTPQEFKSNNKASKKLYLKDSISLVRLIKEDIKEHKGDYHSKAYDYSTKIIIDTIMYNSDFNKLIFFIIDKKENKKAYPETLTKENVDYLIKEGNADIPYEGFHYTGKAYIGIRENDSLYINNYFRMTTAGYNIINDVKKEQRVAFFEEYSAVKYKGYEYNLDDKRFWDSDIWSFDK